MLQSQTESLINSDSMRPPDITKVPKSYKKEVLKETYKCDVCQSQYPRKWQVTRHIRSTHFNLLARAPSCEKKQINQVWFEKVLNSDMYIEIKKTGHNTLVMKKIDADADLNVTDTNIKTVDLRPIYPTSNRRAATKNHKCKICSKFFTKKGLKQHMDEIHHKLAKYNCNNCHKMFKRRSEYVNHVCKKRRKIKGVVQLSRGLRTANV